MTDSLQNPIVFFAICGGWALVMIFMFITVTRMCYEIEARSGRPVMKNGLPGFANVIPVALNIGVAADADTQRLRWRMNQRLLVILVGFAFFAVIIGESTG